MFVDAAPLTSRRLVLFAVTLASCLLIGAPCVAAWSDEPALAYRWAASRDIALGTEAVRKLAARPSIQLISPRVGDEWVEGTSVTIAWEVTGPICWVRLYYYGGKCRLGGRSRGSFDGYIAKRVSAIETVQWVIPWIDARALRVRVAGFDANGERRAWFERTVHFRPRELAGVPDTCIAIIKRKQRLYYYQDGNIARMHVVSTARPGHTTPQMKPGDYSRRRGALGQVFRKSPWPRSRRYNCTMPYWLAITSSGSHGIHGTSPNLYHRLGRPASHGCIRQHRRDAKKLYELVPIGTPVYIF